MTKKRKPRKTSTDSPAMPSAPRGESHHVNIRKISNGYVMSHSGHREGRYYDREVFTPKKPKITLSGDIKKMEKKIGNRLI